MIYLLALLIGVVAGLRAMLAPTAVSWAANRAGLDLSGHWFAFLGYAWTPWILTIAAIGELVNDKLPKTPSRLVPPQFAVRLILGATSGAAIASSSGDWIVGFFLGAVGAVIGTIGGASARSAMAAFFGRDRAAALIEDVVAIVSAFAIVGIAG